MSKRQETRDKRQEVKSSQPATAKLVEKRVDVEQLLSDLQRTRADFENFRKNTDVAMERKANVVKNTTLMKIIPVVDDIERATSHLPAELAENEWAKGVVALREKLLKDLAELGIQKINAEVGTVFNPDYHEAVQMDDEGGENEVVAEELRSGWMIDGDVVRPAMVRVVKK